MVVEAGADLAGGSDDEGFAGSFDVGAHACAAFFPVSNDVFGEGFEPFGGSVDGVDDGDGCFDAGPFGVVEGEGDVVCCSIEVFLGDAVGESDFDEAGFEVDGHGGFVVDGAGEVVDVDVVAEDVAGVAVVEGDGGAGEGDEGGVGEGVA